MRSSNLKSCPGCFDFSEFCAEVSANRKAVFLNCLFWLKSGLPALGCTSEQRFLFFTNCSEKPGRPTRLKCLCLFHQRLIKIADDLVVLYSPRTRSARDSRRRITRAALPVHHDFRRDAGANCSLKLATVPYAPAPHSTSTSPGATFPSGQSCRKQSPDSHTGPTMSARASVPGACARRA